MGERQTFGSLSDKQAIEATPLSSRMHAETVYEQLCATAEAHGDRPAVSFQIKSGPKDKAETLDWRAYRARVTQAANLFRSLGVGPKDVVAYLLPNCNETAVTLIAGATAGIVNPINPLLEVDQIAAILRETGAKVLVSLAPFPKTDVASKAHQAVAQAPNVTAVLEVDLNRYLTPPLSWIVPLIRPRTQRAPHARTLDFNREVRKMRADALEFAEDGGSDALGAFFHTGGTTGMPKIAQHRQIGMLYNGLCPATVLITADDVMFCPLPLFHVFAAYPILMTCISSGAHMVMPTPQGYRGEGVFDNFWKLIERWGVTFMVTVPTAASALMQRKIDADVSSLKYALCGSAPLPVELFKQFEAATGVSILEGYGMTEATCLVSINPPHGERKIGSVGLPFPYTDVKILHHDDAGNTTGECGIDEIGEICVQNPGVFPGYREEERNQGIFSTDGYLRTGDLGRKDADGYVWITGRAKDLIIRGGHNIDPALIEEAMAGHPDVAFVGAIGQPDAHAGEVPCAYVELKSGASATGEDLVAYATEHVVERAAVPKFIGVLDELPKTAVGKVFKPALRKLAISRVYSAALSKAGIDAEINVIEDKTRGLVAEVIPKGPGTDSEAISAVLGPFPRPWQLAMTDT